jgi:AAA15 family ATPase/GTPase
MLKSVLLHNVKSHLSTQLRFDDSRLHALVGQNGCGKTSVLQALHYLSRLSNACIADVSTYERPEFMVTRNQNKMSISIVTMGNYPEARSIACEFEHNHSPKLIVNDNIYTERGGVTASLRGKIYIPPDLQRAVHLKLSTSNLSKASYSERMTPQVEFDGSGLAPNLDYLRDEYPDRLQSLQEMLKRIVPSVRRVGVRRAKVVVNRQRLIEVDGKSIPYEESQEITGKEVVLDMDTGERIPGQAVSEGTMLSLGLLTVLMNPQQPNLILLDDIEQGLHPKAQRELVAVFKEIIQENSDLQIIFTTHSPYIIDELQPSQVHVLSNAGDGFTKTKRLDEHPDVEWAKQTLTTGEFWDAEGEDWVIDGATND